MRRTSDVRRIVAACRIETGLTQVMKVTAETKRGRALKARIRENGVDGVLKAIENVKNSPFLKGKNKRGFVASFDWLITSPDNFQKTLEGIPRRSSSLKTTFPLLTTPAKPIRSRSTWRRRKPATTPAGHSLRRRRCRSRPPR